MPIYPYKCTACDAYQELMLPAPPPEYLTAGECYASGEKQACTLKRVWKAPGIGPLKSSGIAGKMAQQ